MIKLAIEMTDIPAPGLVGSRILFGISKLLL
jgi:hypothetical protein